MYTIEFTADIDLTAAAADGKPPRVEILAYTGGQMTVAGFGSVVVDLAGVVLAGAIPLLADHDATLKGIVGTGTPRVEAGKLLVSGTLADSDAARQIVALHRAGVPFQASIGLTPDRAAMTRIEAGATARVNGQTLTAAAGGFTLVRRGSLREVSILALGADSATAVSIAAAAAKGTIMTDTNIVSTDPIAAERERGLAIMAMYADEAPDVRAKAIAEGWDLDRAELELLRARDRAAKLDDLRAARPTFGHKRVPGANHVGSTVDLLAAATLLRAGRDRAAVDGFGERTVQQAHDLRASSLVDLCGHALRFEGVAPPAGRAEMIRAAFSTISLPTALGNAAGKSLLEAYRETPATWAGFAKVMSAANFKDQTAIRPSFVGQLESLGASGEVAHGSMEEALFPWSIGTFAKQFRITRQDVINDDLSVFDQTMPLLGKAAARSVSDLVWTVILANAGSFFSSGHANYLEAGSSLDVGSLSDAIKAMRKQRYARAVDLSIEPKILAVPPELELTARALLESTEVQQSAAGDPSGNALKGAASLVVESRLSNTDRFATASATAWYLFAAPQDAAAIVGFLDGKTTPTVETFGMDHDINTLGLGFRVYHDYGAALGDYRAAVKATGAA